MDSFEEERLVQQTREEVDNFVEQIRIERGSDFDLAFAGPGEVQRRIESMNQVTAHAMRRFQELCNFVRDNVFIDNKEETIDRLYREFVRIPEATRGK